MKAFSSTLCRLLSGILLLGAAPSLAHADCETIDLNRNTELKNMPMLDQDGTGLCYAFVAAQLIEFKLRAARKGFSPSPIDLALLDGTRARFWERDTLWGGFTQNAIAAAAKFGVASRSCVKREIRAFSKDTGQTSEQFLTILEKLQQNTSVFLSEDEERGNTLLSIALDPHVESCNAKPTLDLIRQKGMWNDGVPEALEKILYRCADQRQKMPELKYDFTMQGTDSFMLKKIDDVLAREVPAGVDICSQILKQTEPVMNSLRGESPPKLRGQRSNINECSGHSVMAVGRMKIGGKCHYLIRNSWGAAWTGNGQTCACKTPSGAYYADCNALKRPDSELRKSNREAWTKANHEYNSRIYVGCWFDGKNLAANITEVGALQ